MRPVAFDWDIIDFKSDYMLLNLDFAKPEEVSANSPDDLVLTFWNGDLFKSEATGESIPNGTKLTLLLSKQTTRAELDEYEGYGKTMAQIVFFTFVGGLLLLLVCQGSLIPLYGFFETV